MEIVLGEPDAMLHDVQDPHHNLGYVPAVCWWKTKENFADGERHSTFVHRQEMEVYPVDKKLCKGVFEEEMSQHLFLGTAVASGINVLIPKTADQLQCSVQNSVHDLPIQINDRPVQNNNTKLVPRL